VPRNCLSLTFIIIALKALRIQPRDANGELFGCYCRISFEPVEASLSALAG
jgi:hypothetical protein